MTRSIFLISLFFLCCTTPRLRLPQRASALTGTAFYQQAASYKWQERDSLVWTESSRGNIPSFLSRLVPVDVSITDSSTGRRIKATFFVSPDYLSIGTDADWARVHITPYTAQRIADTLHCFLPTRKMVDDIWKAAKLKLEPVPMYAFRDSTPTMYHHHLIVEGQRKGRKGLIAGIQKDVVISGKLSRTAKGDRVAIYGWHYTSGKPIQPLYTGHVYWWVDYSQGIRLVYEMIKVDGNWMHYSKVLEHPLYRRLLCDEEYCDIYKYRY